MDNVLTEEPLEQRVSRLLKREQPFVSLEQAETADFAAKDSFRKMHLLEALELYLKAACGYEGLPELDVERAYMIDKSAKCIDFILKDNKGHDLGERYVNMKEEAARIFFENKKYIDAGYAFLWAAKGCCSLQDYDRAEKLLRMSDNSFELAGDVTKCTTRRDYVLSQITANSELCMTARQD